MLIDKGYAYECFCTEEELEQSREDQLASGIASPKYDYITGVDSSIESWKNRKDTQFKKVASDFDFDDTKKMSELKSAYEASLEKENPRVNLEVGDIVIAKTVEGNYALIKFTDGSKNENDAWLSWSFSLKTVE